MRRVFSASTLVPVVIIAAVAAMVIGANLREVRREGRTSDPLALPGAPGAPATSRDGLAARAIEMEQRLAADSDDAAAAVVLADVLLRQSRVTGDGGLVQRAEAALNRALAGEAGNYDVKQMLAAVFLSQHRFADALKIAEECRKIRPGDAVNAGIIGDAHLELGDYDAAFAAFDDMMRLRPNAASYARASYARELQGDLEGALEAMLLAASASEGGDREAMAWYRAHVGELRLQLGQPDRAMQEFAVASQAFPGHPFATVGYADALARLGRTDEARALLEDLARTAPTPDIHARLGELYAARGDADQAARQFARAEAAWRADAREPNALARFLADRGDKTAEAVAIAEAAIKVRGDIFTEDALAWAYYKAGRFADARAAMARALRTGSRDPLLRRHADAIAGAPHQMAAR